MWYSIYKIILFSCLASLEAKAPELPLCPTNMQYFPQNLPMHCRLPIPSASVRPLPGKPMEFLPQSVPGFPGPIPGSMPGMIPGPMPMAPMAPMLSQPPSQKLPVVVMPYYSPDTKNHKKHKSNHKRRPKHYYSTDEDSTDTDTDTSSDDSSERSNESGWWRRHRNGRRLNRHKPKRRRHQNKDLLTPVLQYVTKDGYVIFEKQISKGEAKNWIGNKKAEAVKKEPQPMIEVNTTSKEYRDEKFLRDGENEEVKTKEDPREVHQRKAIKRRPLKKHAN